MSGYWHVSDVSSDFDRDNNSHGNRVKNAARKEKPAKPKRQRVTACSSPNDDALRLDGEQKKKKAEWLSGSWPLKAFDGSLPTHKRKAEWVRFRDQFERIVSCKAAVDPTTKLTGMKIFAGDYLLNVVEMQEKLSASKTGDIYERVVKAVDGYFNQTCDTSKERMIFREMQMQAGEPFVDWVLKLELQAKFCEFGEEQRKEELVQALIRRSVPAIAEKLYEMSHIWDNDVEKIISYGKHLDYIRAEAKEARDKAENTSSSSGIMESTSGNAQYKVVNALQARRKSFTERFEPYKRKEYNRFSSRLQSGNMQPHTGRRSNAGCQRCGRAHGPRDCKAFRVKCFKCGTVGHFAEYCLSPPSNHGKSRYLKRNDPAIDVREQAGMINQVSIDNFEE